MLEHTKTTKKKTFMIRACVGRKWNEKLCNERSVGQVSQSPDGEAGFSEFRHDTLTFLRRKKMQLRALDHSAFFLFILKPLRNCSRSKLSKVCSWSKDKVDSFRTKKDMRIGFQESNNQDFSYTLLNKTDPSWNNMLLLIRSKTIQMARCLQKYGRVVLKSTVA